MREQPLETLDPKTNGGHPDCRSAQARPGQVWRETVGRGRASGQEWPAGTDRSAGHSPHSLSLTENRLCRARKYSDVDLSLEEPTPKADPELELLDVELGADGLRFTSSVRSNSPLGRAVQCLVLALVFFGLPAGAGEMAQHLSFGPVGITVAAAMGLITAVAIVGFAYKKPGAVADRQEPASRPPTQQRSRNKRGRKASRR